LPAEEEEELASCTVNGKEVSVPKGSTVMQACEAAGVDIPRFCYHPKLSIAGNCRMCLVEIVGAPKVAASCAMPLMPGSNILTDSPKVRKAREGVMEFLLLNHPLDCPICDQGGECDLQDQAVHFGSDRGRFVGMKRSVVDKNIGPLVKTVMTRCIHCTRCVRFATEVAGVPELGMTGRGNASEIGTYVEKLMDSELSGNVIDLCPVGALTSKPYAFTARPWELKSTETIDVSDAIGCNIRVDSRGTEVLRIVPRNNETVNEDWISDKARFQYDGLARQRLNVPMVRANGGALAPASWPDALAAVRDAVAAAGGGTSVRAIAGKLACAESLVALKDLMNRLGCEDVRTEAAMAGLDCDVRSSYVFNSTIAGVDNADCVLLIGTNPRAEAPVLNARLRKATYEGVPVGIVGESVDLTYGVTHVGDAVDALATKHPFLDMLKAAKRPMVIVGSGVLQRHDAGPVLSAIHAFVEKAGVVDAATGWNGYNVLHDAASRVAALDLGLSPPTPSPSTAKAAPAPKVVFLLGADDFDPAEVPADAFVVYQGSHGDVGANLADVILPGAAFVEKPGVYVNAEGRAQEARRAVPALGEARDDWKVLRALSEVCGVTLPYDDLDGVRARMAEVAPHLAKVGASPEPPMWLNGAFFSAHAATKGGAAPAKEDGTLRTNIDNFYMTDVISRASLTMAKATQAKFKLAKA